MEDIINRIAHFLDIDPREIQEKHLFKPNGECTAFGQKLTDCKVQQCWDEVVRKSDYDNRRKSVDEFNRISHLRKRGLAIAPTTFSIGFCTLSCNQGAALLHVYTDGSVLITHGGVEMGQGLHIKMAQVASRALKIPIEKIYINETATDKVPNTTSSAASLSSDLYGAAILDACQKLLDRIAPYKKRNPSGQWVDWIKEAYTDRVALSATGFHKIPHMTGWNYKDLTKPTEMFSYYCYGAGVSEVEIDCLTGDHRVLRTDIVMDVGTSMNPAIDIGQVEGAFAQGMGLFTMEELMYSPRGLLLTRGPGAYKIPSVCDIPREFNVTLLRGSENPRAVYSSKAVGEPPLCLASAVFLAIKDAITYKRGGRRKGGDFRLDSPATAERIRMACEDTITLKVERAEKPGSFTPWSITV